MQPITNLELTAIVFPSILLGIMLGYFIGTMRSLRIVGRAALSLVLSIIGGVIFSLLFDFFIPISTYTVLLSTISILGGAILGLVYNWIPPDEHVRENHIIYESDDDEEFDREIKESLGGRQ